MKSHTNIEVETSHSTDDRSTVNISVPENTDVTVEVTEALPEQVLRNVETLTSHQDRHQQNTTADRRILNKIAAFFARPGFLYFQIGFFAVWIGCTNLAQRNIIPKNFPLFDLHLHGLEVASLLISTEVLIAQAHQEKVEEERTHLAIQLDLVTEQKIAKLISLVEELRTDLPNVKNRTDAEAEEMQQAIDPQAILDIIHKNATHTLTEELATKSEPN
ncbi:DUF1003 domain-containing protein [Chamaesiphon polymorphus]|uniref:DUF1003 domain-containing protein n=1 Tax=Chamaesiphon polymorphus CCALA 037 TaxID=2107692 RepID=A0A2T1G308_9CYAN|nr:DUF1003 domain-containing protein [Chamaesiphon polymorphus]PSB51546.1 DUF1003 domain-containing protein [Chamaesiphon polymorphus CCALA 037]